MRAGDPRGPGVLPDGEGDAEGALVAAIRKPLQARNPRIVNETTLNLSLSKELLILALCNVEEASHGISEMDFPIL